MVQVLATQQASRDKRRKARQKKQAHGADHNSKKKKNEKAGTNQPKQKGKIREWIDAVVFALVVMLIIRTFIFDLFRIPTPSMEKNLLVGDYLFVSKLHYGTRTPRTIGIPFTQIYLKGVSLPSTRLPGFSEVKRGDALVFNFPPEDKPIDKKMYYIKRVVGMPGESLELRDKVVHIDGSPLPISEGMQQFWNVFTTDQRVALSGTALNALGVTDFEKTSDVTVRIVATSEAVEEIREWPWVDHVEPYIAPSNVGYSALMFSPGRGYTPDNFGPVNIPKQGETVTLTLENWPIYQDVITRYEEQSARLLDTGSFEIEGVETNEYTFKQDYFFMMGDNRDNSEDSRFWGFVPMDHVVCKATLIYFSWDAEATLPRFNRLFNLIR